MLSDAIINPTLTALEWSAVDTQVCKDVGQVAQDWIARVDENYAGELKDYPLLQPDSLIASLVSLLLMAAATSALIALARDTRSKREKILDQKLERRERRELEQEQELASWMMDVTGEEKRQE